MGIVKLRRSIPGKEMMGLFNALKRFRKHRRWCCNPGDWSRECGIVLDAMYFKLYCFKEGLHGRYQDCINIRGGKVIPWIVSTLSIVIGNINTHKVQPYQIGSDSL
jgi:hypothetical protein